MNTMHILKECSNLNFDIRPLNRGPTVFIKFPKKANSISTKVTSYYYLPHAAILIFLEVDCIREASITLPYATNISPAFRVST